MDKDIKCDICSGVDYFEIKTCHICGRNYCELCESIDTCELCTTCDNNEE